MNIRLEGTQEELVSALNGVIRLYPNRRGGGYRTYINDVSPEQLKTLFRNDD